MDHASVQFALDTSLERMCANKTKLTDDGRKDSVLEANSEDVTTINAMLKELHDCYKESDSVSMKTLSEYLEKFKKTCHNTCKECDKMFVNPYIMSLHKTWHKHLFYNCEQCGSVFTKAENLMRHLLVHDSDFTICEFCRPSRFIRDIKKHFTVNHEYIEYYCTFCKKFFSLKYMLIHHLIGVHDVLESNINIESYHCKTCKEYMDSRLLLRKHLKEHENFFYCELCFEVFYDELVLEEHHHTCLKTSNK